MNAAFGSSQYFGSIVGSKYIAYNTYINRKRKLYSKPTPINGPVHKSKIIFSYSIRYFSFLPQTVSKIVINSFSQKVKCSYIVISPVISVFSTNEEINHLHICDHTIITFGKIVFCLGFSNTYHVDSLNSFSRLVF